MLCIQRRDGYRGSRRRLERRLRRNGACIQRRDRVQTLTREVDRTESRLHSAQGQLLRSAQGQLLHSAQGQLLHSAQGQLLHSAQGCGMCARFVRVSDAAGVCGGYMRRVYAGASESGLPQRRAPVVWRVMCSVVHILCMHQTRTDTDSEDGLIHAAFSVVRACGVQCGLRVEDPSPSESHASECGGCMCGGYMRRVYAAGVCGGCMKYTRSICGVRV
jgi:hypothetical protein